MNRTRNVARVSLVWLVIASAVFVAGHARAAAGDTILVSQATGILGTGANGASDTQSISETGRYVAFESSSNALSTDDTDASDDIFVRDVVGNTTTFISRATGPTGAGAENDARYPAISADGNVVAFVSSADNLSTEDTDSRLDTFTRNIATNTTTLISRASGVNGAVANDDDFLIDFTYRSSVSRDGRYVAFMTKERFDATHHPFDTIGIYVRDTVANTTTYVSRATGADGQGAELDAWAPSISEDGRYVAFQTWADNLTDADTERNSVTYDIFVRDTATNTTTYVSRANGANGNGGNNDSESPSISDDGRFVAFESDGDNLSNEDIDENNEGCSPACHQYDVFVRDIARGTTTFASRANGVSGAGADDGSFGPQISDDGRYVAFSTSATNLSNLDVGSPAPDVYMRDVHGDAAFEVNDVTMKEGKKGTTDFVFTVSMGSFKTTPTQVSYATQGGAGTGGAVAPNDYEETSATLTFNVGEHSKQFTVHVVGDKKREKTETFTVVLSNASAGTPIADATGVGTIKNDDR